MANNKNFVVKNGLIVGTDATIGSTLYVSTVDTTDSSAITVVPSTTFNSDVSIENDLRVTNAIENASGNTILPAILGAADQVLSVNSAGNGASWKSISDIFGGGIDNVVDDTTPQLGGNLDLNSQDITGTGNINITGNITASGSLFVPTIDTADSSAITVVPSATFNSDVTVENTLYSTAAFIDNLGVPDALYVDFIKPRPETGNDITISGEVSFSGKVNANIFDTTDSSAIVFTPAIEFESDVRVQNNVVVENQVDAARFKGDGSLLTNLQISLFDLSDTNVAGQGTSTLLKYDGLKYVPTSLTENSSGDVTANSKVKINYSSTTEPALAIESTDSTSNASPELELYKNSTSADGHYLGQIKFAGENDTGGKVNYAKITGKILDNTNGTEDGILEFAFQKAGSQNISARFRSDGLQLINGTNFTVNGTTTLEDTVTVNANIVVTGTVDGRDVAIDGAKLDTIESNATADQTAAEILAALITVDGTGTSLDADLLDGQHGSHYLDGANFTGTLPNDYVTLGTMTAGDYMVNVSGTANEIEITHTQAEGSTATIGLPDDVTIGNELTVTTGLFTPLIDTTDSSGITVVPSVTFNSDVNIQNDLRVTNSIENASGSTLLPATLGTANQVLTVNAAGNAEWSTISTGGLNNVVEDTTPQLGGDLDLNSQDITGTGNINITGTVTADELVLADNEKIKLGSSVDFEIYHDGSHSYVDDRGTGDLRLRGNGSVKIMQYNNSEQMAAFKVDGAVELYYDNVKKFETTSTGVDVTGNVVVSGTVDGRDVATDGTKLDTIETNATADQTAAEILTAIKTVDGTGSGLDADTVDGIEAAAITQSGDSVALTGDVTGSTTVAADGTISVATTIAANSITLGTDTTGDYVATVTGTANEVEVTGSGGETAAVTVGLPSDVTVSNNLTVGGYLAGPASFTIDPAGVGDNTGTVIIAGDLQVDGTTTTINSTTVTVDDLNLTLASGSANAAAANGAGITVDGANATITYDSTNDEWDFNKNINITGNLILSGTVDGRDVASDGTKLDTIETNATADQTAAEILTAIKTVDGASSGLDADLLDSQEGSYYLDGANFTGTLPNNYVTLGTMTTGDYVATITGTANEVEVTGSGSETAAVTIGLPNDVTIGNDLTVTGTINGLQVNDGNGNDVQSTAVGVDALINVNSGTLRNTAFGKDTLKDNTSGERNTAVGSTAMANATTGGYNTAIGQAAMGAGIVTGSSNAALGATALESLENGSSNTAVGRGSLSENTSGNNNTAIGKSALFRNTTGVQNVAIGSTALALSSTGAVSNNVAIGNAALDGLDPGQNGNTAIGAGAGRDLDTGTENIIIGLSAEASATNMSNEITLGDDGAKSFRIPGSSFYINGGSEGTTGSNVGIGTSSPSTELDVAGSITASGSLFVPTIDTADSSAITIIPGATFNSDVTVENELKVRNGIENISGNILLPASLGSANQVLTVNAAGTGAEWAATTGGGISSRTEEHPTVTNGAATVTMGAAYTLAQLDVYLNGARMKSGTDYSVSSTTLTFAENLSTGDIVALYAYDTSENLITGNWSDLNDVSVTGASANAMVRYDGGNWAVSQTTEDSSGNVTVAGNISTSSGNVTVAGDITATGSLFVPTIDTSDSSAITITPAAVFSSDVTVENDLTVSNDVTATVYYGDGSQLTGISAGATGGSTDQVFYENDQVVTTDYTISTNRNAMTAGPITINSGVTITIPTGSEWSIV